MEFRIGKTAEPGASASVRAAEMIVKMARGKAQAAADQVTRTRKKFKAAKKAFKQSKKAARQAKKSLKTAQAALEIAKTKSIKSGVRKAEPAPAATRLSAVRPRRKSKPSRPRQKLTTLKEAQGEVAPRSPEVGSKPAANAAVVASIAPEPNGAGS